MSIDALKKRFHDLGSERDEIIAQSAPATAVREAVRDRIGELERVAQALTAEIKRIETPLFGIDMERGSLVRALKGKTGEPPSSRTTPMNAEAISGLIQSMNLGRAVTVQVVGASAPDARVDDIIREISEIRARVEAQSVPVSFDPSAIYADMKSIEEAVKSQMAGLKELTKAIADVQRDLGTFASLIEKAKA